MLRWTEETRFQCILKRCESFSTLYYDFRKKLPFPETLWGDINHIIPDQMAGESFYPLARN